LYQDVLLRRVNLASAAARLSSQDARQLAYEMAVCVCDADGQTSPKEDEFLRQLREAFWGQSPASVTQSTATPVPASAYANFDRDAQAVATAPLQADAIETMITLPASLSVPHPVEVDTLQQPETQRVQSTMSTQELDSKILKASILNGAIELLPENLSTLAIIPLQMRLVYQIGHSYGYKLDSGHIKDFLATLGVGLTSQYLEQAGRKLLGGLLGKVGGGLLGGLGKQAVSSSMSFASTYALGHVANQYYAGGRTLSTEMLKNAYQHVMQDGRQLQSRYLPQMQETARGLNTAKILSMVRGA
jgi:uncharacterized protein (DUF697 family)